MGNYPGFYIAYGAFIEPQIETRTKIITKYNRDTGAPEMEEKTSTKKIWPEWTQPLFDYIYYDRPDFDDSIHCLENVVPTSEGDGPLIWVAEESGGKRIFVGAFLDSRSGNGWELCESARLPELEVYQRQEVYDFLVGNGVSYADIGLHIVDNGEW